jgi:hypothetical protein
LIFRLKLEHGFTLIEKRILPQIDPS